jgi:hypothetical protein
MKIICLVMMCLLQAKGATNAETALPESKLWPHWQSTKTTVIINGTS